MTRRRFSLAKIAQLAAPKILKIRAGAKPHRMIGIWMVVVGGRLFVRSWSVKPDGWFDTFLRTRRGTLIVGTRKIPVRAVHSRSDRLKDAVTLAYAKKYTRPGDKLFVRGFRSKARRNATLELLPVDT